MGGTLSSETASGGGGGGGGADADPEDAWAERAWADGVPFTLLHDDAFVNEKFQELQRARGVDAAKADADDALEMTGVDELPRDELERMADAARIKLFAARRGQRKQLDGSVASDNTHHHDAEPPRKVLSALEAMTGTALERNSRTWLTIERRRAKQCEIVREYMSRLATRLEKRAKEAAERERDRSNKNDHGTVCTQTTSIGLSGRGGGASCGALPGSSLFQVASFRMQLEMLKAFRTTNATLFEHGVLSIVSTVLEFPSFALHETETSGGKEASVDAVHVEDAYRFCKDMIQLQDLSAPHRDVLLVLLLSLGTCSGRSTLLIEFVAEFVRTSADSDMKSSLTNVVGDRSLGEWIQDFLSRLESYRVQYKLGTLKDESLLRQVSIKAIKDEAPSGKEESERKRTTSIATDGSYVYTWSFSEGLSKIGTGLNFTVAGRVYVRAPPSQYLELLRERRNFHCGFYGSGLDATRLLQEFASNPTTQYFDEVVLLSLSAEDRQFGNSKPPRLFALLERDGAQTSVVFDDHEQLCTAFTEPGFVEGVDILFAFYGHFQQLSDASMSFLREVTAKEVEESGSAGVVLDSTLMNRILTQSDTHADALSEKQLILLFSSSSAPRHLFLEKFSEGDVISSFEQQGDKVYFSSMVFCGGQIYLSLLYPRAFVGATSTDDIRHEPRILLQISPADLRFNGKLILSGRENDQALGLSREARVSRPLFSYVTEGRRLYEVEVSAERFRVRVFGGLGGSKTTKETVFLRLFDVNVKQIQCATYVNCLLKILKSELRVGDYDFVIPSFLTNGCYMWMVLPSVSPIPTSQASESAPKFNCFIIDCETGHIVPEDLDPPEVVTLDEKRYLRSFERALPSSSCCFDATNNLIWVFNTDRGVLSVFKNTGRSIPITDETDDDVPPEILKQPDENSSAAEQVLRLLTFLVNHSYDRMHATKLAFSPESNVAIIECLLDLCEWFLASYERAASKIDTECLRCCLNILHRSFRDWVEVSDSSTAALQVRLAYLLNSIIHHEQAQGPQNHTEGQQFDLRVVSAALGLSAQTSHLVDPDMSAQLDRATNLVERWSRQSLSPSEFVVTMNLLRQLRTTVEVTADSAVPSTSKILQWFKRLWGELVVAQERLIGDTNDAEVSNAVHRELIAFINFFIQHTFVRALRNVDAFQFALNVFGIVCDGTTSECSRMASRLREEKHSQAKLEKHLLDGLVRHVTPTFLVIATTMLRNWSEVSITFDGRHAELHRDGLGESSHNCDENALRSELGEWLKSMSHSLCKLYQSLGDVAAAVGADAQTKSVSTVSRTTRTEIMESSHEYQNSLDVTHELKIPGATQITITFDARSRTEFSYDYVTFYKDKAQTSYYGEQYYSGRDAEINWPGVNGLPPLVIDSDHCFVYFHTDATNTDWGYRFTAVGELYEETSIVQRHWLTALTEMALGLIDEAARLLVESTQLVPISEAEARNERILHSELVRHGVADEREQDAGVLRLLREFAHPREDSDAARVLVSIDRESRSSRPRSSARSAFAADISLISVNPISTAIRATTAAILHHNMWAMDAYALAQNLRSDVSEQLLRGWKNAQKMRDWFHLGDAADAVKSGLDSPRTRSSRNLLRRQPSAYKGMSDEALAVLSKNVVDRASFLLELTPMSFSYVSGAKRRWGFLARYGSALGVGKPPLSKSSSNSTLGKWYNLLDDLQEATELRSLLNYRRSSSERLKNKRAKSVTEQVLEFIQSDVDVGELRELMNRRNRRGEYRACGLWIHRSVASAGRSKELKLALVESYCVSLRKVATNAAVALSALDASSNVSETLPSQLHFGSFLSGCDGATRKNLNDAFGAIVNHCVQELARQDIFDTEYSVVLTKAICIDYDSDDAYLLQESNLLPQLLRLLACKASRVRRSGQVLLDILLSRLGDSLDVKCDPDDDSASQFQKQLYATVGLQLEGIASQLRDLRSSSPSSNGLGDREHNLCNLVGGLTTPVTNDCDVKWNHSIMLWIYASSTDTSYSLKVGDLVRRGPSWSEEDSEQGVDNRSRTGLVTAITSETSVRVKWCGHSEENEYEFNPRKGKLNVVLADETHDGVLFCKGSKNLLHDTRMAPPWSHFGLFLNEKRQLVYKVSCGPSKDCEYETNYELDCDEWSHVAIVQNEEVLKFYINGLMVTQHVLDPFLVLQNGFSASESRMIESIHPATDSTDSYWPVHIPGASKIRVTFDPLSEIDQTSGFVRFYKNARCNDIWGEDKYTGRYHDPERNFPGALSNRHRSRRSVAAAMTSHSALEIPSDRFLVYFHHSGDSTGWGFRLLATPSFASEHTSNSWQPSLNSDPLFIGEPPARVLDARAARCWIYRPEIVNIPLEEDEIVEDMQALCPPVAPSEPSLERALHVVGLLQSCCDTMQGRDMIATPENVGDLIMLAFDEIAPVEVRCASVMVLKDLCVVLPADIVAEQFKRIRPIDAESDDFVGFVFGALVSVVNSWSSRRDHCNSTSRDLGDDEFESMDTRSPADLHLSSIAGQALITAYVSLFRHLPKNTDWLDRVCEVTVSALSSWKMLQNVMENALDESWSSGCHNMRWNEAAASVTAVLVVLGGGYDGISIGSRVRCCANIDSKETIENGYLLRFQHEGGVRSARILFDCEPTHPVNVPVKDVAYLDDGNREELGGFLALVAPKLFTGTIQRLFSHVLKELDADLPHEKVAFKPKISRKENVEVLESEHPYVSGEDITYPLVVRGAQEIVIYFDEQSCTAGRNDYVAFVKRADDNRSSTNVEANNGKPYWGEERYYGENFPGVRGAPPLRIPASSVDVHFYTEASSMGTCVPSTEWGFKLTAHAYEETIAFAPEFPPDFRTNAINDIYARSVKSLHACVQLLQSSPLYPAVSCAMSPLVPYIARLANSSDDGLPTQWPSKEQAFESKHPYDNSVKEIMSVAFTGAARLIITFDAQSKTEQGNDYVTFFKDQTMSATWGQPQYSGADDSANWPGCGDRGPLVIPSDSFTLLWVTDATNVDWGWRFTVTVEYPIISPMSLRLDQLNKQAHDLWEIFYEGTGPQRVPFAEEYDGFDKFTSKEEWHASIIQNDPNRYLLLSHLLPGSSPTNPTASQKFRVVDKAGVDVIDSPSASGIVLGRLQAGDEFYIVSEHASWVKIHSVTVGDTVALSGWIKRRTDDESHVVAIDTLLQNEDVHVIGVDDDVSHLSKLSDNLYLNGNNTEVEQLTMFVSQFNTESLQGQSTRYQSLAYDTHRALATKYAREALHLLIVANKSHADSSANQLQLSDFGSACDLILLLSHLMNLRKDALYQDTLEDGLRHLFVSKNDSAFERSLINQCLDILDTGTRLLPAGRGTMRVLESRHPYPDDADLYWQVSIPGAKRILVYFDPQSRTEEDCDWVCFYKNGTNRGQFFGESMYHGRNGKENWPGFDGRAPLVIDADNFEVYFHSDGNQNDWGFKLFAIGVHDEADPRTNPLPLDKVKTNVMLKLMRLALWMLSVAAKACLLSPHGSTTLLESFVFSSRTVEVLAAGIQDHPHQVRTRGLQVLQLLVQNLAFVHSLPSNIVETLHNKLITKVRAQFLAEDRSETKSEYLQMLVECAVLVDLAADSACFSRLENLDSTHERRTIKLASSAGPCGVKSFEWTAPSLEAGGTCHVQIVLPVFSGTFALELVIERTTSTADTKTQSEVLFRWESSGEIVLSPLCGTSDDAVSPSLLQSRDVVSIFLDLANHVLVLRKNTLCVYSSSRVDREKTFIASSSRLRMTVTASTDEEYLEMRRLPMSPLALLPTPIAPNWYNRVCDAVSLLLDFEEQRVAAIVECESEHPLPASPPSHSKHELRERVSIQGAEALEIRFDRRTALSDRHRLRFFSGHENQIVQADLVGIRGTNCDDEYPALFLNDPVKRTGILKPGDQVVRSSDWCYANEDGGPGGLGVVEAIVPWNERNGCGVRVTWTVPLNPDLHDTRTGIYRYGYDGFFDVEIYRRPKAWDVPLIIPGNCLEYTLDYIQDESGDESIKLNNGAEFRGTFCIDPLSATALRLDIRKTKLMLGDDCTIEFWISALAKSFETSEASSTDFSLMEITPLDPTSGVCIRTSSDGRLTATIRTDQGEGDTLPCEYGAPGRVLVANEWAHIAVVFSSSKMSVYVNGDRVLVVALDSKLLGQKLYISSLVFGHATKNLSATPLHAAISPLPCHICDVRVWNVGLRSEQVSSHAHGIESVSGNDQEGWQNMPTLPAPRKQSRSSQVSTLYPPPSPSRSPRSPSRATGIPLQNRKWVTANRTGRDLVTVRADCPIPTEMETDEGPVMIYYEAHILSSGKVCVGFAEVNVKPSSRTALLGEYKHAMGLELPRKCAHFSGEEAIELEEASYELRSPRKRSSSSGGAFFGGDVFSRDGDVVGCAYVPATKDFSFYLNGELVAQAQLEDGRATPSVGAQADAPSPRRLQREFDLLVDEMLTMGFSRQASEDALEATAGSASRTVPRAVDWLLDEGTSVASPRRLSSSSPFASPRRRLSSASSGTPSRRLVVSGKNSELKTFVPAATLGAQGAQGIAWNFGHLAFKYTPPFDGQVISAMSAGTRVCDDVNANICFEIFDHGEEKWERVAHHHRVQDITPMLLAHWKLDEGAGSTVYDSSGRDQVGVVKMLPAETASSSILSSPRSRRVASCWDPDCSPPVTSIRSKESPFFATLAGTVAPGVALPSARDESVWGYRFYVIPHYSTQSIGRRRFQTQAHRFIIDGPAVEPRHDYQLIKYVNKVAQTKQLNLSQILRASWSEVAPSENELVKWPALVEVATGVLPSSIGDDTTEGTGTLTGRLRAAALDRLGKRYRLLQEFNSSVSRLLPLVAFSERPSAGVGTRFDKLLADQRYRILHAVKRGLWDEALKRTTEKGEKCDLIVNRPQAMRHRVAGKVDTEGRFALFSQAFRQLSVLGAHCFRRESAIYKVQFLGENAQDAGGPYRETLAQFVDELHSSQLPLLIESSNAQHNVGAAREKWVLNPSATTTTHLQMLEFLGKLMGAAMRSQEYVPLRLALLIWKKLAGEPVTSDDLALVDSMIVSSMEKIRTIDKYGVSSELFEDIVMETFTTLSTDNRMVPLKPHGGSIAVTFESRIEFADLVEAYRLQEFDLQIAALLCGLAKVVPPRLLSLFTGAELEQLVCGSPEVDVDLLQQCTEYSSCSPDDDHIVWFWQVLREFSHEERSAFLRFVWGRSRLPPTEKDFPQRFKLQSFNKTTHGRSADAYLPIAHTCFFSVEMPRYSSIEIVREKLTYAMYNCQEIDGDGDSVAANQLGWEE